MPVSWLKMFAETDEKTQSRMDFESLIPTMSSGALEVSSKTVLAALYIVCVKLYGLEHVTFGNTVRIHKGPLHAFVEVYCAVWPEGWVTWIIRVRDIFRDPSCFDQVETLLDAVIFTALDTLEGRWATLNYMRCDDLSSNSVYIARLNGGGICPIAFYLGSHAPQDFFTMICLHDGDENWSVWQQDKTHARLTSQHHPYNASYCSFPWPEIQQIDPLNGPPGYLTVAGYRDNTAPNTLDEYCKRARHFIDMLQKKHGGDFDPKPLVEWFENAGLGEDDERDFMSVTWPTYLHIALHNLTSFTLPSRSSKTLAPLVILTDEILLKHHRLEILSEEYSLPLRVPEGRLFLEMNRGGGQNHVDCSLCILIEEDQDIYLSWWDTPPTNAPRWTRPIIETWFRCMQLDTASIELLGAPRSPYDFSGSFENHPCVIRREDDEPIFIHSPGFFQS